MPVDVDKTLDEIEKWTVLDLIEFSGDPITSLAVT